MEISLAIVFIILFGLFMTVLHFLIISYLAKDLDEEEKQKYYDDVQRRTFDTIHKDSFGDNWFNPF